ncbi:3-isopropylmalate dehydratase small subunit [Hymenobacter sp. BT683]|uniref:3-isopropylmalate dehydratase n=1 Tax=Hymenobacter jeongseonensis TaxID=2791027 RepID=A0ABS0IIS3_9BACT|nr:3-isopropylmalate dehydratase small subunit [Hymenobacter jeongseonensis]MBF9238278.1 3-isopropylmalate dehydratase small subunit [Hymenobacter jeongseonensis]
MAPIPTLRSTAVPLPIENIDNEQILPPRFLTSDGREGFGAHLFADWRYATTGQPKHGFVLNDTRYHGQILLAGENFGCGASCEQAARALHDAGFKVIIATSFPETFRHNALKNGLLPLVVSPGVYQRLLARVTHYPNTQLVVEASAQTLGVPVWEEIIAFALNADADQQAALLQSFAEADYLPSRQPAAIHPHQ